MEFIPSGPELGFALFLVSFGLGFGLAYTVRKVKPKPHLRLADLYHDSMNQMCIGIGAGRIVRSLAEAPDLTGIFPFETSVGSAFDVGYRLGQEPPPGAGAARLPQ